MPNIIAYASIIAWPLFIIWFFSKYSIRKAILLSIFGSFMFLPAAFEINFPGIPAFDKFTITAMAIIFVLVVLKRQPIGFKSLNKQHKFFFILLVISPILTALNNSTPYIYIPGLTLYDGISQSMDIFLYFFPFLLGYQYFRTYDDQLFLFKFFAIAVLIYGVLAAYEIRMSPQLHNIVYGYFPHDWFQQVRGDGFRSVVFMGHGLMVALFLALGIIIVNALRMTNVRFSPFNNMFLLLFLVLILLLSKSLLALIMGLCGLLVVFLVSYKKIHYVSFFIAAVFFTYPLSTSLKVFPHDTLLDYASMISDDRAQSLGYRFYHEEELLNHAREKPLLGWGTWGRNRVYDPETGEDISVTDGKWILTLGSNGWVGFIAQFYFIFIGLYIAYKACRRNKNLNRNEGILLASHVIIVAFILLDQMPNASLVPFYVFIAGCLLGRSEQVLLDRQSENQIRAS